MDQLVEELQSVDRPKKVRHIARKPALGPVILRRWHRSARVYTKQIYCDLFRNHVNNCQ